MPGSTPKYFYSVYERGTDRPIFIYGTGQQCADALGITRPSFYKQLNRTRQGLPPLRYEIIEHKAENEEDDLT